MKSPDPGRIEEGRIEDARIEQGRIEGGRLPNAPHLSARVLGDLLDETLPPDDAQRAELHLVECDSCQALLESMAGSQPWWTAANELLEREASEWPSQSYSSQSHSSHPHPGLPQPSHPQPDADRQLAERLSTQAAEISRQLERDQVDSILFPTDQPDRLGRFGNYEVIGIIGSGATAIVLKAHDPSLGRNVAIKVLRPTLAVSGLARQRFSREARAVAAITHPAVIEIYGVAEQRGIPYLVMPYIRGQSLARRIAAAGTLELEPLLRIAGQIAQGLSAAHRCGVIHRDVKPSNILLGDGTERVVLTDFGLARAADDLTLTHSGTVAGTPDYMSPEQARGDGLDERSDLFSLGSVVYAMATGHPPFRSDSALGTLRRITDHEFTPLRARRPDTPIWFANFLDGLLAKDTQRRWASADQVAGLCRDCVLHLSDASQPVPSVLRQPTGHGAALRDFLFGNRIRVFGTLLLGLCLLLGLNFLLGGGSLTKDGFFRPRDDNPPTTSGLRQPVAAASDDSGPQVPPDTRWNAGIQKELDEIHNQLRHHEPSLFERGNH
ncbi:MAG: protein kinase [Planctomycetota bacterium]